MQLVKPKGLRQGDTVATISLSWGGAGDLPHRYKVGKHQIESVFGLHVVETTNALKPAQWIYDHPEARAEDLMEAFRDPDIKAIISNIGGEDSIRLLKYIDFNVIRNNPKIFLGFSDSTVTHFMCLKAGVSSFYGTSVLVGFAENGGIHKYQVDDINRTLFNTDVIGEIRPNEEGWTTEYLNWFDTLLQDTKRKLTPSNGWRFLRGESKVQGPLIGGCLEVLDMIKGTIIWPELEVWRGAILFLESSEEKPDPKYVKYWLMGFAAMGILDVINGIIVGRPYDNEFVQEYDDVILQVLNEEGLYSLPVITRMDFGHTCPTFTLPYGRIAEIDCEYKSFSILESAVD